MMLKPAHLLHPWQTAKLARKRLLARFQMQRFAARGERHFAGDPRYNLRSVTDGFASRLDDSGDDGELLERICAAYAAAEKRQRSAPELYGSTAWWERIRQGNLNPVIRALQTRDFRVLSLMYRNFFRDACSIGLIGAPCGMPKPGSGGTIKDVHRRVYLSDTLHRIDYWKARTNGRFALRDLSGPGIGNPFGAWMEGFLLEDGAEYRHYCAQAVGALPGPGHRTVAEIGGGFGGMAYYLLRDRPSAKYVDFDVPESLALTSYYLMKSFPHLKFLLCGEGEVTGDAIARADVVLMPLPELATMPPEAVDVVLSSRAMSDLSPAAMSGYLRDIARMKPSFFLYIGSERGGRLIGDLAAQECASLQLEGTLPSEWHKHTHPDIREVECLYRISSGQPGLQGD